MKRVFAILLTLCLLFGMTACGGQQPTGTQAGGQSTTNPSSSTAGGEPTSSTTADTTPTTTVPPTTANPYEALSGNYLIYHFSTGDTELNYFQLSMSRIGRTNLEFHADGTVTGKIMNSEIPAGNTWDAEALTMTNAEGEIIPFTLEENMLTICIDGGTMVLLKEGDPRLDDLPTAFAYLYDYIVSNGAQDDRGYTVICHNEGRETSMTATDDGGILWRYQDEDSVLEMPLLENSATQSVVMYVYNGMMSMDYTCKATIETAVITKWDIPLVSYEQTPDTSTWGIPDIYETGVESSLRLMLVDIWSYLFSEVGVTMESLGFTAYNS